MCFAEPRWGAFTSTTTDFQAAKGFTNITTGVIFKIAVSHRTQSELCSIVRGDLFRR